MMTLAGERKGPTIVTLLDDVLFTLFRYLDVQSLGRVAQVCKRFNRLVAKECVWIRLQRKLTTVRDARVDKQESSPRLSGKETCRIATQWLNGTFQEVRVVRHKIKQLPWIQFNDYMWISDKNEIRCYRRKRRGTLQELPERALRGHTEDVVRFVAKNGLVVSGARNGSVCSFCSETGRCLLQLEGCHLRDIHGVDFHDNTIITGSRDASVKLWSMDQSDEDPHKSIIITQDRVCSVAFNPGGRSFAVGTAGLNHILPPLNIWDAETSQLVSMLGTNYRHGAGVLDIQYETPHVLLSCGYDTIVRLWDTRASCQKSMLRFEEPFDLTIYCLKSDGQNAIVTGTSHYGMCRLWDKRHKEPVQIYYAGRSSSPVYSLTFDPQHLYVALDRGIHMLNFSGHR